MAPPGTVMRRMRIALLIGERVMFAMIGDPIDYRSFAGQAADERQQPPHRAIGRKAQMREMPVKAQANANAASDPMQHQSEHDRLPRKEKWRRQTPDMDDSEPQHVRPVDQSLRLGRVVALWLLGKPPRFLWRSKRIRLRFAFRATGRRFERANRP